MKLQTVLTYSTRGDAEVGRVVLDAGGVRALVMADDEGGLNPGFYRDYGVRLVVDGDDLASARVLLGIIVLDPQIVAAVRQHARFCTPNEACGLLALDASGAVRMVYCCTNTDESPRLFTIDPEEHFRAMGHAESNGWEIAGAFHSHPDAEARPSRTDIDRWADPTWIHLIVGSKGEVRGYRMVDGSVDELNVEVHG